MAEELARKAAELSDAILGAINKSRDLKPSDHEPYRIVGEIAVSLHLINLYLGSLPPYWIGLDLEHDCRKVLHNLQDITRSEEVPKNSNLLLTFAQFAPKSKKSNLTDLEVRLVTFFKANIEKAENLKTACDNLHEKLAKDGDGANELPDFAMDFDTPGLSKNVRDGVFDALKLIVECKEELHSPDHEDGNGIATTPALADQVVERKLRHPARLSLHEPGNIGIFVSGMKMAIWQEFGLMDQPASAVDDHEELCQGGFCSLLEEDLTLRLFLSFKDDHLFLAKKKGEVLKQIIQEGSWLSLKSVLRDYELTPKDKVTMSYAIAWSYWQHYDSDLMRVPWTSETILFAPANSNGEHEGQLPLCSYIDLPFDVSSTPREDILSEDLRLTHRCPRIFDVGILLLEIGLARAFRTGQRKNPIAQANLNHKMATDSLIELEKTNWEGVTNIKKYFDGAVRFCLKSENFIRSPRQTNMIRHDDALMRKRIFYKNVVCPLAWLTKRGFRAQAGDVTYIDRKRSRSPQRRATDTQWQPEPQTLFHSGTPIRPEKWLEGLKIIGAEVGRRRRRVGVETPVRVAILDSGLNRNFSAFKAKKGLLDSIVAEEDFVDAESSMKDDYGHGTFMARLVMESSAPGVEILVARIAENTAKLEGSQKNITKAILWAGREGKADIISMSFGFPHEDEGICEAIETLKRERKDKIIFLASAGNSHTDDESFPARHPAVVSVFATDCYGTFLRSNSASSSNGAMTLGTFGDDIPESLKDEFGTKSYTGVCQPGSSVATAIMAGIAATMLAYADTLSSFGPPGTASSQVLQCLRTTKGLEALLRQMPRPRQDADHPRRKAVDPRQFWKDSPGHWDRYCAIYNTLVPVYRKTSHP